MGGSARVDRVPIAKLIEEFGDDPAIRLTPSNETVANIFLATNQQWRDDDGERPEHTA